MSWDLWLQYAQAAAPVAVPLLTHAAAFAGGATNTIAKTVIPPLLTPVASVAGEALAERVKARVGAVAVKAVEMVGPEPKGILSDLTSLAIIRAAASVDDPDLHIMFARLLAAEIQHGQVHPSFVRFLAEMTPGDARLFRSIAEGNPPLAGRTMNDAFVFGDPHFLYEAVNSLVDADLIVLDIVFGDVLKVSPDEVAAIEKRIAERGELVSGSLEKFGRLLLTKRGRRFAKVVLPPR